MHPIFRQVFNRVFGNFARKEDLNQLYAQLAGFQQIQRFIAPKAILGPLRNWAMSPDAIVHILTHLQTREKPTMIEFGSGQSTIIFSSFFKQRGGGRLISIEHDAEYAAEVQTQINALGLADLVELKVVTLQPVTNSPTSEPCASYDLSALSVGLIDVALVDGPPYTNGSMTRFYPLQWALEHLNSGGAVFLDDANRPSEVEVVQEITRKWPTVRIRKLPAEKGLVQVSLG